MVRILTFLICILFTEFSYAQFTDTTQYVVTFSPTGSLNKTNDSRAYLLNNTLKFGIKKKSISLNFNNNWIYGKQNSQLTNNDYSSTLDFNLYKTFPHFFYWGLANYNTSRSLKINNQLLAGLGVAYNIYDREEAYLNISNGILFDSSDLDLGGGLHDQYETTRNSFRLSFKFIIRKAVTLSSTSFIQNSLNDQNDYIIRSNAGLSLKLNRWISFTTAYNYNKISRTKRENTLLSYGLTFERYF
ncbi:DUF481 domain-containing protein [Pedobacter duraquae]|uniref:Uncharacterized protein DUF481 n=1 Tax=Pedobacter duraquae TaxID=425511 RepID=A0A4R6IQ11_9SPHI|nr:DUF481 domain-containing protein [Pedobacter duraquae]TDO24277.1 uncharacterized protein DUF481 [Pedobacter duraquae]